MMHESERRSGQRLAEKGAVFIEVMSSSDLRTGHGQILISNTIEISTSGLRVELDQAIEVETILQLAVKLGKLEAAMYVVGEVRWCAPAPDGRGFQAGFELLESEGTDIETWRALVMAVNRP